MAPETAAPPAISVIVPVYRQWDLLPRLLADLAAQEAAPGFEVPAFEVIIVDNEPEAGAKPVAAPAGLALRILPCAAPGSYAARNLGAAAARGALLVFTDADCQPPPGWLAALATGAAAHPGALLAGPVAVTAGPDPNPCEIYDMIRGIPQARYVARGYAATANLAAPRAVFEAAGGFDPRRFSGGDADFCRRAGALGHPLRLVPGAVTHHPARADWAELAEKARRIKGGQIAAGPWRRRLAWALRTLCPPVRDTRAYLAAEAPWRRRRIAVALRLRLWGVELAELLRLVAGGAPGR